MCVRLCACEIVCICAIVCVMCVHMCVKVIVMKVLVPAGAIAEVIFGSVGLGTEKGERE